MAIKFLKNTTTGAVFFYNDAIAAHPSVVEIGSEEFIETIRLRAEEMQRRAASRDALRELADADGVTEALQELREVTDAARGIGTVTEAGACEVAEQNVKKATKKKPRKKKAASKKDAGPPPIEPGVASVDSLLGGVDEGA
jgi:hypothetical protein